MSELKNCPFCGGKAVFEEPEFSGLNIFCGDCGVMLPSKEIWNTRTPTLNWRDIEIELPDKDMMCLVLTIDDDGLRQIRSAFYSYGIFCDGIFNVKYWLPESELLKTIGGE